MKRDSEQTKARILQCAIKLFAEKGFDGARVDELAGLAGVNKALIYYYFKSKEEILETIFDCFIKEANGILMEMASTGVSFDSKEMGLYMKQYSKYLLENSDILKIMMIESIKGKTKVPPVFKLIDISSPEGTDEEQIIIEMQKRGFNLETNRNQRLIIEFFTGIIPEICFSIFRKQWCNHFKVSNADCVTMFKKAIDMTHKEHYKNK